MEKNNRQNNLFNNIFIICLAFVVIFFIEYPILHNDSLNRFVWIPGLFMVLLACLAIKRDLKFDIRWFLAFFALISIIVCGIVVSNKLTSLSHWFAGFAFILAMLSVKLFSENRISKNLFDSIYIFAVLLTAILTIYCFTPIANMSYFEGKLLISEYYAFNLDNSNAAGMYLFGIFCIIIINLPVRRFKLINIALCCALFYMLFRTDSRSCIAAAIIVIIAAIWPKKGYVPKFFIIIAWLFPIVFVSLYLYMYESGFQNVEILGKSLFSGRQNVFSSYLSKIENGWHVLFGNFGSAYLQNAHNAPLSFYSSLGIVGLIITELMLLISVLKVNNGTKVSFVSVFAILGLFIQSSAEVGFFSGGFPGIIFLIVFFLLANYEDYDLNKVENKKKKQI